MEKSKAIHLEVGDIVQYYDDDKMVGLLVSIHRARHSQNDSYGVHNGLMKKYTIVGMNPCNTSNIT